MKLSCLFLAAACVLAAAEPPQEFRLPNGLRVVLVEDHERPLVRLELRTARHPAEEAGLGGCLADLLRVGGAAPAQREAFRRLLEDRALRLAFSERSQSFGWSLLSDSQGQDGAFESLAAAAARQDFDPATVEARKRYWLEESRQRSPRQRAEARFARSIGDPSAPGLPEEARLVQVAYQDFPDLARRVLRPERSVLVVYGDLNLSQARQLAMLHLGAWGPRSGPPAVSLQDPRPVRAWVVRDAGGAIRIRVGAAWPGERGLRDSVRSIVAWQVERDLAAGLPPALEGAGFRSFPDGGWMLEAAAARGRTVPEAVEGARSLLRRLRETRVGPETWVAARQAWDTERRIRKLHPAEEAGALADAALRQDRLDEQPEGIALAEIQETFGRMFLPEAACSWFIEGATLQDAAWLRGAGLGPAEVVN